MLDKFVVFLTGLRMIGRFFALVFKMISWVTPKGMHIIYSYFNFKGKAHVKVDDVSITDESETGFKATVHLSVEGKNSEAVTIVKTEITNKPHNALKI